MHDAIQDINQRLLKYFDALYFGDVGLFAELFHPQASLFCATGDFVSMDVRSYLDIVAARQSPSARHDPRQDRILSISVPTATTAHARVQELFLPKRFTDELVFIRAGNEWKIISKVWHFDLSPGA